MIFGHELSNKINVFKNMFYLPVSRCHTHCFALLVVLRNVVLVAASVIRRPS